MIAAGTVLECYKRDSGYDAMKENQVRVLVLALLLGVLGAALYMPRYLNHRKHNTRQTGPGPSGMFKGRPVLLEYTSTTCSACKGMKPVVAKLEKEFKGKVDFMKVDVESAEAQALMQYYPPQYLPSFYLLVDENTVFDQFEGGLPIDALRSFIRELLTESKKKKYKLS